MNVPVWWGVGGMWEISSPFLQFLLGTYSYSKKSKAIGEIKITVAFYDTPSNTKMTAYGSRHLLKPWTAAQRDL